MEFTQRWRLSKRSGCSRPQRGVVVGDVTEDLWLQISKPAGVVVYDHEVAKVLSRRRESDVWVDAEVAPVARAGHRDCRSCVLYREDRSVVRTLVNR